MNVRNIFKKSAVAFSALAASGLALAQEVGPDPFAAALSTITDKVGTYGGGLVGLAAVGVVFMVAMKYVKKLPRAS